MKLPDLTLRTVSGVRVDGTGALLIFQIVISEREIFNVKKNKTIFFLTQI